MKKNRLQRLKALMAVSFLLLTAFVVQWLIDQYNIEYLTLRGDLLREFKLSEEKTLDTMILTDVIHPIIHHSTKSGTESFNDSLNPGTFSRRIIRTIGTGHRGTALPELRDSLSARINLNENRIIRDLPNDSAHSVNFFFSGEDPDEPQNRILLKGIKMLATIVHDSISENEPDILAFFQYPDTAFFQNSFNEKIDKRKFHALWRMQGDTLKKSADREGIQLESSLFRKKIGVTIYGYNFYLLREITPHISFAFILLSLSGAAFILSFRNLKKQYELTGIRNAFVSNITHELKTPVATMKVALEALRSFNGLEDPKVTNEYLGIFSQETDRLDQLIQKVLSVSVSEESSQWIHPETLDFRELIEEIITSVRPRLEFEKAILNLEIIGENLKIKADKLHIQGAILNLIDNSLKYSQNAPDLKLLIDSAGSSLQFSLCDNGIGIPPEYHSRVFDRFFRVPSGNIHNIKGYGLGLTYVYMVMQHHGGTVSLKNNSTAGCTFTLAFPKSGT